MPPGQTIGSDTSTLADNARGALEAGLNCEVPWDMNYGQIESIVAADSNYNAMVTESATLILEQKFRFNAHDANGPYGPRSTVTRLSSAGSIMDNESHLLLAQEAAAKSMVLLKNEGDVLPIPDGRTVAVLGGEAESMVLSDCGYNPETCPRQIVNFATDIRTGDRGSSRVKSNPAQISSPLDGITAAAARHGASVVSDAATADYVVAVVGLTAQDEGEEYTGASDRYTFALNGKSPGNQDQMVQDAAVAASARGVPMVVVLVGGSVIDMPWLNSVDAVIMSWYPGQMGGAALGDLLFGDENFGGKLPITWATEGWPTFDEGQTTNMNYYIGYKLFDVTGVTPIYPFGHGLSYSTFEYSNIRVNPSDCATVSKGAVVGVEVDITNSSTVEGEEVAFLFVSWPNTSRVRGVDASGSKVPDKELKGFVRTDPIAPSATVTVTIPLSIADLKYWNMATNAWEVESGQVDIMVGPSSANLPMTTSVTVE
jgi:beta-glucosidase